MNALFFNDHVNIQNCRYCSDENSHRFSGRGPSSLGTRYELAWVSFSIGWPPSSTGFYPLGYNELGINFSQQFLNELRQRIIIDACQNIQKRNVLKLVFTSVFSKVAFVLNIFAVTFAVVNLFMLK